jgi:hypothetical protein
MMVFSIVLWFDSVCRALFTRVCLSHHQVEDNLLVTVAEGEISVDIDVGEDDNGVDVLSYSSQSISVTCV